jgi:hypothetical protein
MRTRRHWRVTGSGAVEEGVEVEEEAAGATGVTRPRTVSAIRHNASTWHNADTWPDAAR